MKRSVVLPWVAATCAAWGGPVPTLDESQLSFLGPRENFERFMNRAAAFVLHFADQSTGKQHGIVVPYSTSTDGELRARIETAFSAELEQFASDLEKETPIVATIGVRYVIEPPHGDFKGLYLEIGTQKPEFLLQRDDDERIQFPTNSILGWPLVQYVVLTNVMQEYAIEGIEYVWEHTSSGNVSLNLMTANGSRSLFSDQMSLMVVPAPYVDETFLRHSRNNGYFVIHYNKEKGWREWFDIRTGQKIGSSITTLQPGRSNSMPQVEISGFRGSQVSMETSTNGSDWEITDSAPLNPDGKAMFVLTNEFQVLLARARSALPAALTLGNPSHSTATVPTEPFTNYLMWLMDGSLQPLDR